MSCHQAGCCAPSTSKSRDGSVLNPLFPAPVNTYNPTVHALVDAIFDALEPHRAGKGARRRLRQPLDHHRRPQHLYRQRLRAVRDLRRRRRRAREQGRRVRHQRQPIATPRSRRSRSSRANSRPACTRFELIADSGGAGEFRGGLGIRREYVNLADARFSIRSTKHIIAPNGCAGGGTGRTGDIRINPEHAARTSVCRRAMPTIR